jgi:hypothetical protein
LKLSATTHTFVKNNPAMKELTIKIKDESRLKFLLELLSQLDFIEFETSFFKKKKKDAPHNFFQSAGLFTDREIDAKNLRKQAWRLPS